LTFKLNTPETKHLSLLKCQPISFSSYGALITFNYRDDLFEMTDIYFCGIKSFHTTWHISKYRCPKLENKKLY